MKKATKSAAMVAALMVATACSKASTPAASKPVPPNSPVTVDIHNFAFNPNPVAVHAGQTVVWHFDDGSIPHNVSGAGWASADKTSGDYAHTFTTPGTYAYHCTIHKGMDGQLVVSP